MAAHVAILRPLDTDASAGETDEANPFREHAAAYALAIGEVNADYDPTAALREEMRRIEHNAALDRLFFPDQLPVYAEAVDAVTDVLRENGVVADGQDGPPAAGRRAGNGADRRAGAALAPGRGRGRPLEREHPARLGGRRAERNDAAGRPAFVAGTEAPTAEPCHSPGAGPRVRCFTVCSCSVSGVGTRGVIVRTEPVRHA